MGKNSASQQQYGHERRDGRVNDDAQLLIRSTKGDADASRVIDRHGKYLFGGAHALGIRTTQRRGSGPPSGVSHAVSRQRAATCW